VWEGSVQLLVRGLVFHQLGKDRKPQEVPHLGSAVGEEVAGEPVGLVVPVAELRAYPRMPKDSMEVPLLVMGMLQPTD
jgi:hypothetical protein